MKNIPIQETDTHYDLFTGALHGEGTMYIERKIKDIAPVFSDQDAVKAMEPNTTVYYVKSHQVVKQGKEGGLFFGTSYVNPGLVGNEYFMTKGHFHSNSDTAEYYWCISGEGVLILLSDNNQVSAEKIQKGSIHYIPGNTAHRIANTGKNVMIVGACWPSDAGHDYKTIIQNGFGYRLLKVDGTPTLVKDE